MARRKKKRKDISLKEKIFNFQLSPEAKKSIWGIFFIFLSVFFVLSVLGLGGKAGAGLSNFIISFFGKGGAWVISVLFLIIGLSISLSDRSHPYSSSLLGGLLFLFSTFGILDLIKENFGGRLGNWFVYFPKNIFGIVGGWAFFIAIFLISLSILGNTSILKRFYLWLKRIREKKKAKKEEKRGEREKEKVVLKEGEAVVKVKELQTEKKEGILTKKEIKKEEEFLEHGLKEVPGKYKYKTLPLALLDRGENNAIGGNLRANAQIIKRTFQNFGIPVEMGEINVGPTVTQYTLKPAEGIKVSKLLSLQRDLALALAAHPIRMEAPIPGKSLVGIEVPNQKRAEVRLSDLLNNNYFFSSPPLVVPIGKDVMGEPFFANIERMPHLLVAGATGTGKTVCLNSLILSILWKNSPETVRFVMIDPKRVEFTLYKNLPHLLCPPIIHTSKVIPVIKWLIEEMEERFGILHDAGQRDIISYNQMIEHKREKMKNNNKKEELPPKMPYIIVIIDELADIMAAKGKEFEAGIVRLAQMSRATGIHLILATQRPSVEVLTGLIKANITTRIAFQVASQVDSRTVLDMAGAERLLGRGDMLFLSSETGKPKRLQCAYVSSAEVKRVVEYLQKTEKNVDKELEESLTETLEKVEESEFSDFSEGGGGDDELYEEAKRVVIRARKASASLLQRRLKIGYARAARLLDMLEENGIVGPSQGAKPRDVYITEEQIEEEQI